MLLPRIAAAFRGGDDHLLSSGARLIEEQGFRLLGAHEVAPEILVPEGTLGRVQPSGARPCRYRAWGSTICAPPDRSTSGRRWWWPGEHVLAVEAAEGTDQMLERVAELRASGRIRASPSAACW